MPFFSIIIPVHNGGDLFNRCLRSIANSTFQDYELIVVDDGSNPPIKDNPATIKVLRGQTSIPAHMLLNTPHLGPAAARNLGAQHATGRFIFFTDADCQLHPDTLAQAANVLQSNPSLDALFGAYDDTPAAQNLVSQYKNLQHHYVHQTASTDAKTFWTGCGAVRRTIFLALGGFDVAQFPRPSIEDIEFGYRLSASGGKIELAKNVQVKHLKRWTLSSLIKTDVRDRAIPWTRLLQSRPEIASELNLNWSQRISGVCVLGLLGSAVAERKGVPLFSLTLLWLNRDFYRFLHRVRGYRFLLGAIPLHWLYFLYSTLTFLAVTAQTKFGRFFSAPLR